MKIIFKKLNDAQHILSFTRSNRTKEEVVFNTDTYFLYHLGHLVVEAELKLRDCFYGLLASGHSMAELTEKNNPLTATLRMIEPLVAGVLSVYSGQMTEEEFWESLKKIQFVLNEPEFLKASVEKIEASMKAWKYLPKGQVLLFQF